VAKLVTVTGGYAIDATEVTRSQYEAWLSTNPSTGGQRSECSWNTVFSPASGCMSGERVCQGSGCGQHPQVCVDWCDAVAYCQGVGKRLCGKIGGGANAYGDYKDATKSQWYKACTSDGQNGYPYLDAYSAQACNGWDKGIQTTVETGSLRICQSSSSGYKGVYDLSGNVWEWEDSCSDTYGLSDNCRLRGGSFNRDDIGLRCDSDSDSDFLSRDPTGGDVIGFRCCSP
jgi:formylglycine-generating enzyme required for sulfatase activity